MGDMMDDINKYAKIWDSALEKGIFKDAPKKVKNSEDSFFGSDFFGQNLSSEYDMDEPLNESQTDYWSEVARMAGNSYHYSKFLNESKKDVKNESKKDVKNESKKDVKKVADKIGNAHNPVYPNTYGKDQNVDPTQNWAVGGKEHFQLEELKVGLEKLESKLNSMDTKGSSTKDVQSKIDNIKKEIDKLSDSLSGNRWTKDG
jgi:hypothetical protein